MDKTSIIVSRPGVYLFHAPTKVSLQINRELLLLLSVPESSLVGLLLVDQDQHLSDLPVLLNTLLGKIYEHVPRGTHLVRAKLLGMSQPVVALPALLKKWVAEQGLSLTAEDLGKNVTRKIYVDCESGLAGVSYAEGFVDPSWLDSGSAKKRIDATVGKFRVLTLSKSSVKKGLCQQAIDELDQWSSFNPEAPFDFIIGSKKDLTEYSAVIIFEDLTKSHDKPLKHYLSFLQKKYSHLKIFWVGSRKPEYARDAVTLPILTHTSVKKFKKVIQSELLMISASGPGEVIAFPKRSKTA